MIKRRIETRDAFGPFVAQALNNPRKGDGTFQQLRELVLNLKALSQDLHSSWERDKWKHETAREKRLWREIDRWLGSWRIRFIAYPDTTKKSKLAVDWVSDESFGIAREQWAAFLSLLRLLETDSLHRLRRCDFCKKWFYAGRREDQKFCNERCRQRQHDSTPERKEYHKLKAREIYDRDYRDGRKKKSSKESKHGTRKKR